MRVLLLFAVIFVSARAMREGDSLLVVKKRLLEELGEPTEEIAHEAEKYASTLRKDGTWADIDYKDKSRSGWKTATHMSRVEVMAKALYGSPAAKNVTVADTTISALSFWLKEDFTNPNWWWNDIGIPTDMSTTFLMLNAADKMGALTAAEVAVARKIMERAWWGTEWTGANLVWMVKVQIVRGCTFGNDTAVTQAFSRLWKEIYWSHQPDDNIQRDGSFHQHSGGGRGALLAGSYGAEYTGDMLNLYGVSVNTTFEMPPDITSIFASLILDGQQWMTTPTGAWDWAVVGRGTSRPGGAGHVNMPTDVLKEMKTRKEEFANYIELLDGSKAWVPLSGNRHFYDSDYMVHRRASYMVSLRMYSNRTIAARCVNEEGKKDQHTADGVTALYVGDTDPYTDVFPVWDFYHLPGISIEEDIPLLHCDESSYDKWPKAMNYTTFVGGSSDGMYGCATMALTSRTLSASLAWFFFDDVYVHLVAGMRCSSSSTVATTLVNRLLGGPLHVRQGAGSVLPVPPGNHSFPLSDALWFHHMTHGESSVGTGYVPLSSASHTSDTLRLRIGNRTGTWQAIGTHTGEITRATVEGTWAHGTCAHLAGAEAAYAVLPQISLNDMSKAAMTLPKILVNTDTVQSVFDTTANVLQVVFWDKGCVNGGAGWEVCANHASVVVVREISNGVMVTASNPDKPGLPLQVTINRVLAGKGCASSDQTTTMSFTLPSGDFLGKSVTVSCAKTT